MAEKIIKYAVKRVLFFKGRRYDPTVTPFAYFPEGVKVDPKTFVPVAPVSEIPAANGYDATAEKQIQALAMEHGLDGAALKQIYDDASAATSKEKLTALETYHQLVTGEPDPTEPEDAPNPGDAGDQDDAGDPNETSDPKEAEAPKDAEVPEEHEGRKPAAAAGKKATGAKKSTGAAKK